jgi:membrane protease subunit (stomatin/prohibitin family)
MSINVTLHCTQQQEQEQQKQQQEEGNAPLSASSPSHTHSFLSECGKIRPDRPKRHRTSLLPASSPLADDHVLAQNPDPQLASWTKG